MSISDVMSMIELSGLITRFENHMKVVSRTLDKFPGYELSIDELDEIAKDAAYVYSNIFGLLRSNDLPGPVTNNGLIRMQSIILGCQPELAIAILKLYPSFLPVDLMPYGMNYSKNALAAMHARQ